MRFAIALLIGVVPAIVIADDGAAAKRVAELAKLIDDLKKPDLRPPPRAPWPKDVRGRVEAYKDGYVLLNLGLDAGLQGNMAADVYREDKNDTRYLGTIVVERVYPKEAVGRFVPAGGKDLKDAKPGELPKKSDAVGKFDGKK